MILDRSVICMCPEYHGQISPVCPDDTGQICHLHVSGVSRTDLSGESGCYWTDLSFLCPEDPGQICPVSPDDTGQICHCMCPEYHGQICPVSPDVTGRICHSCVRRILDRSVR